MKPLLKNTKENCNREEKQEEDNMLKLITDCKSLLSLTF